MLLEWMFHYTNIIARCFAVGHLNIYFAVACDKSYVTYMPTFILWMINTSLVYGF